MCFTLEPFFRGNLVDTFTHNHLRGLKSLPRSNPLYRVHYKQNKTPLPAPITKICFLLALPLLPLIPLAMVSLLLSFPPLFAFYISWVIFSLLRPLTIVFIACVLWNLPTTIQKARLSFMGVAYMLFCKDKKYSVLDVRDHYDLFSGSSSSSSSRKVERKELVFVRHGESTWNDTFNKGERPLKAFLLGFVPGLVKSAATEVYLLLSGQCDSWFIDSPLSVYGLGQIDKLAKFLERGGKGVTEGERRWMGVLRGEEGRSVLVSSNLRRALR